MYDIKYYTIEINNTIIDERTNKQIYQEMSEVYIDFINNKFVNEILFLSFILSIRPFIV